MDTRSKQALQTNSKDAQHSEPSTKVKLLLKARPRQDSAHDDVQETTLKRQRELTSDKHLSKPHTQPSEKGLLKSDEDSKKLQKESEEEAKYQLIMLSQKTHSKIQSSLSQLKDTLHMPNKDSKIDFPGQSIQNLVLPDKESPVLAKQKDKSCELAIDKKTRQKKEEQVSCRRSSRLEKQDNSKKPMYCVDRMSLRQYQESMYWQEMKKSEDEMLKFVIQKSLLAETKYKDCKEHAEKYPQQWYKNFVKEQFQHFPEEYIELPGLLGLEKPRIKKDYEDKLELRSSTSSAEYPKTKQVSHSVKPQSPKRETKAQAKAEQKRQLQSQKTQALSSSETESEYELPQSQPTVVQEIKSQFLEPLPVAKKQRGDDAFHLDVVNFMDTKIRDNYTSYLKFVDFQKAQNLENELYGPAQMQKKQDTKGTDDHIILSPQKSVQMTAATSEVGNSQLSLGNYLQDRNKSHFIKQKQSQCNVKRECGVSYVKKTESSQLNVRDSYDKLPPIVIQGSYTLPRNDGQFYDEDELYDLVEDSLQNLFFTYNPFNLLVIACFETLNEISMKNYLLKPHKRLQIANGKFYILRQQANKKSILQELWKFVKDKHFLCVHMIYDSNQVARAFQFDSSSKLSMLEQVKEFIVKSDVCLGFLPKKGNASVKSMLKVYKIEDSYSQYMAGDSLSLEKAIHCQGAVLQGINTIAYLGRLELYVSEQHWKSASMHQKGALTAFINLLEDKMAKVLLHWNKQRTNVFRTGEFEENITQLISFSDEAIKQCTKMKSADFKPWEKLTKKLVLDEVEKDLTKLQGLVGMEIQDPLEMMGLLKKQAPLPITLINTRDCFAYDLKCTEEVLNLGKGREKVIKKVWYFDPDIEGGYPANFKQTLGYTSKTDMKDIQNLQIGVTSYENFFTHEEMKDIEENILNTEQQSLRDEFLPMTAQKTIMGGTLKRTKFFFGYRYMWTKTQLQDPLSNVAAGVRADVSQAPVWMKTKVEEPLVKGKIIEKNFINSIAMNVYHDGSEGLAQHFDDATRFKQPIFTLRLFSDSRLSFGSQYYGFQNSAFFIPLPRGCICVMEEASYSANGIKHCIRPCDMTGKSCAVILRQMHPNVVSEANKLDRNIDMAMWMSTLSLEDEAMPFYMQKEKECEWLERKVNGCTSVSQNKQIKSPLKLAPKNANDKFPVNSSQSQIEFVMNKILNRVEAKVHEENEFLHKIYSLRQKTKDDEVVQLFKTNKNQMIVAK